jgi:hypothetical protein
MMAILSASFLIEVAHRLGASGKFAAWSVRAGHWSRLTVSALFCLVIVGSSITYSHKIWTRKIPEESERRAFLIRKFGGYELMSSLPDRGSGTIYQLGFEDEIYLLGPDVRGDWFGPGRYRDVLSLTEDAEGLARHLAAIGADGLLINRVREPFSSQVWDPALSTHFHLVRQTDRAVLYWKRNPVYAVNPYRPD